MEQRALLLVMPFLRLKLNEGINSRQLYNFERNNDTTTSTSFEEFVKVEFKNVLR